MPPSFLDSLVQIVEHGRNTNSYKFALFRALADWGSTSSSGSIISLSWVAERFLSYYWSLVANKVRQATDPTRNPVIMKLIQEALDKLQLPSRTSLKRFRTRYPNDFQLLIEKCCRSGGCFDEVVPRFHTVRRHIVDPPLYEYDLSRGEIQLGANVSEFLKDYHRVLRLLAIGGWVRFTEQFTSAPRLYNKIEGTPPFRRQSQYRPILEAIQGPTCFFCTKGFEQSPHVDHVIPWSFVFEDRIWNLVLACAPCNNQKLDLVPNDKYLNRLTDRNQSLLDTLHMAEAPITIGRASHRDLREFERRDLGEHVRTLAADCRNEGFGTWNVPD